MAKENLRKEREVILKVNDNDIRIIQRTADKERELYVYNLFLLAVWDQNGSTKSSHIFFQSGRKPIFKGEALQEVHFANGDFQFIELMVADEYIALNDMLRLSFFAMTDDGAMLVSFYPTLKDFARQLVMFFSHKSLGIALAQHFSASWMLEIYKKK